MEGMLEFYGNECWFVANISKLYLIYMKQNFFFSKQKK